MRETLPSRRHCHQIDFTHDGMKHFGTVSTYRDGRPGELFIVAGKVGSAYEALARDTAVAASLALQFGCSLSTLRQAITRLDNGKAAGALGQMLDLVEDMAAC